MKILFIANNKQNDFLSDAVFHGLLCMDNVEVVDVIENGESSIETPTEEQ